MGVSASRLSEEIAAGRPPAILDVRSASEFARGHVPGAMNVPFWQPFRLTGLSASRDKPLVVYCELGPRAWLAGFVLRCAGFRQVSFLNGHMFRWRARRFPQDRAR